MRNIGESKDDYKIGLKVDIEAEEEGEGAELDKQQQADRKKTI